MYFQGVVIFVSKTIWVLVVFVLQVLESIKLYINLIIVQDYYSCESSKLSAPLSRQQTRDASIVDNILTLPVILRSVQVDIKYRTAVKLL